MNRRRKRKQDYQDKQTMRALLLNQWLKIRQENISVKSFFTERDITTIAIYGAGYVLERLLKELDNSEVQICGIIDRSAEELNLPYPTFTPKDKLPEVDAIVVTLSFEYEEVKRLLRTKVNIPIISIDEVIFSR